MTTKSKTIRADEVVFYQEDVHLPEHKGTYRAIPHDRADRADSVLFMNANKHYVYIQEDVLVQKQQTN